MGLNKYYRLSITVLTLLLIFSCKSKPGEKRTISEIELPERGFCAHRGAMETHPENTLIAFHEAINAGAQMIEFDVFLTKDKEMVILHDATVDRTTNGTGRVMDLTLEEIKKLDAGSWKSHEFIDEKIPTLKEVLEIMPINIWLNIHVKGEDLLHILVAKTIAENNRLHQALMACSISGAGKAKEIVPNIMICNMDRRESNLDYVKETIEMKANFIQFRQPIDPAFSDYSKILKENGVRVNFYGTDSPDEIRKLFGYGIDFILVNDIKKSISVAPELNIKPVKPVFAFK